MSLMQMKTGHCSDPCEVIIVSSVVWSLADAPAEGSPLFRGPLLRHENQKATVQLYRKNMPQAGFRHLETISELVL